MVKSAFQAKSQRQDLNEFVKGNEHRETFFVNLSSFTHVKIFAIHMCANEH